MKTKLVNLWIWGSSLIANSLLKVSSYSLWGDLRWFRVCRGGTVFLVLFSLFWSPSILYKQLTTMDSFFIGKLYLLWVLIISVFTYYQIKSKRGNRQSIFWKLFDFSFSTFFLYCLQTEQRQRQNKTWDTEYGRVAVVFEFCFSVAEAYPKSCLTQEHRNSYNLFNWKYFFS